MSKSFCIKTNNKQIINYLLNNFYNIKLKDLYISNLKFKIYNNLIIHYTGKDIDNFYNIFSDIFSSSIIKFYEKDIIKHIIKCNYFYFIDIEQEMIYKIANDYLYNNDLEEVLLRKKSIMSSCIEYFTNNKAVILDGFVNFRINDYLKIIDYIVDLSVNKFIIDREYTEFINLLKSYINSKPFGIHLIHIIYKNQESTLLDEFNNIINLDNCILNNKLLSDISFSSNDYALNILLTLLPEKIYIHIINGTEDEFINTLKLIFDKRISICNNCNICKVYRLEKINK